MRISFFSLSQERISAKLNMPNFARLAEVEGVSISFDEDVPPASDIILLMGYDAGVIPGLRQAHPGSRIGIVDPRPSYKHDRNAADFIVANGWEMRDHYAAQCGKIFIYPIYQEIMPFSRLHADTGQICLGYHGNKVNLQIAYPVITEAIDRLGHEMPVELKAMYNIDEYGALGQAVCGSHVKYTSVQYDVKRIPEFLSGIDIGLIPNLIPYSLSIWQNWRARLYRGKLNYHQSDVVLRYKNTANPGRLFYFIQAGIPVVAGNLPSTGQLIRDGEDGCLAISAGSWYRALKLLAESALQRRTMAARMWEKYSATLSVPAINARFADFLKTV